jgi:hypothetical protein
MRAVGHDRRRRHGWSSRRRKLRHADDRRSIALDRREPPRRRLGDLARERSVLDHRREPAARRDRSRTRPRSIRDRARQRLDRPRAHERIIDVREPALVVHELHEVRRPPLRVRRRRRRAIVRLGDHGIDAGTHRGEQLVRRAHEVRVDVDPRADPPTAARDDPRRDTARVQQAPQRPQLRELDRQITAERDEHRDRRALLQRTDQRDRDLVDRRRARVVPRRRVDRPLARRDHLRRFGSRRHHDRHRRSLIVQRLDHDALEPRARERCERLAILLDACAPLGESDHHADT